MKQRITVTLDKECLEWLDKKVDSRTFANRSHGFEFLIARFIEKKERENFQPEQPGEDMMGKNAKKHHN